VRILYLAFLIALVIFTFILVLYSYNYAFATMSREVDALVEEARSSAGVTAAYTSFIQSLDPYLYGLNVILVLALVVAIIAIFLYSRRRD